MHAISVDLFKAFHRVSHPRLPELIHEKRRNEVPVNCAAQSGQSKSSGLSEWVSFKWVGCYKRGSILKLTRFTYIVKGLTLQAEPKFLIHADLPRTINSPRRFGTPYGSQKSRQFSGANSPRSSVGKCKIMPISGCHLNGCTLGGTYWKERRRGRIWGQLLLTACRGQLTAVS